MPIAQEEKQNIADPEPASENTKKKKRREFDSPWKLALGVFFEDFMAYCCPALYREIDWTKGYKMRDKELNKITGKSLGGNQHVDKLVEVYLKNGQATFILLHIEVQYTKQYKFPERMFIYHALSQHTYQKPIVSLAILIDGDPDWKPNTYHAELLGSSITMKFNVVKILDYKNHIPELEASNNRFAPVMLAQLYALEKNGPHDKLISKTALTRNLFSKQWKKNEISQLFNFIDWLITLPAELEELYNIEADKIQEKCRMRPYTTREKVLMRQLESSHQAGLQMGLDQGLEKGLEQGLQKGESAALLRLLAMKFRSIPKSYENRIQNADLDAIHRWFERAMTNQTLEEVFEG